MIKGFLQIRVELNIWDLQLPTREKLLVKSSFLTWPRFRDQIQIHAMNFLSFGSQGSFRLACCHSTPIYRNSEILTAPSFREIHPKFKEFENWLWLSKISDYCVFIRLLLHFPQWTAPLKFASVKPPNFSLELFPKFTHQNEADCLLFIHISH